jgi:hypothetical protein
MVGFEEIATSGIALLAMTGYSITLAMTEYRVGSRDDDATDINQYRYYATLATKSCQREVLRTTHHMPYKVR